VTCFPSIQVTFPGLDDINGDSDAEDDLEEILFAEECAELLHGL
jgi:hypothetical protein